MREELREIFEKEGYPVVCIAEFGHVTDDILQAAPGLVLLDINLPGISGFEICRELKRKAMLPVMVLTSRDQMKDELHALNLGADEYLTKPCRKERLLARAANLLRRYEGRGHLRPGKDFLLDSQTYTLYIHDQSVVLPQNQGKLLAAFLAHPDELVTKETLCMALWGTTEYIDENALQVNLTRLKKTMKELEMVQQIETVRGLGYRLTAEEKIDDE
jgi:DNA-binding response OmpR family regulator